MLKRLGGRRRGRIPLPPAAMMHAIGAEDAEGFVTVGREFVRYFQDLAGLRPDEDVLEVGSGAGRMALQLAGFLDKRATYEAFDIYKDGVEWCQQQITPRHRSFRFHHADLFSSRYNQTGTGKGSEYVFPWADDSFDFVFLTSVFTHLLPRDLEQYMREIARVLRPEGRCLITWFLLNDQSKALLAEGRGPLSFIPQDDVYWVNSYEVPEWAVAYDEGFVLDQYRRNGLVPRRPFEYGAWCGREEFLTAHDVIVADLPAT